jgi:hypothetical protein
MSVVMAFFFNADKPALAVPLSNQEALQVVMRTVQAMAVLNHAESYQLMRLNYQAPPTPISHRFILQP